MQGEDGVWLDFVEQPFLKHQLGAPAGIRARLYQAGALLGGLEDEHHGALDFITHAGQHLGSGHQHGGVGVVAAGMHHVDLGAVIEAGGPGGKGQPFGLLDRQGVHIRPQRHGATGPGALEDADHAGAANFGFHLHAERAQMLGHQRRCAGFLLAQLRVLMNIPSPFDQMLFDGGRFLANLLFQGACCALRAGAATECQCGNQRGVERGV